MHGEHSELLRAIIEDFAPCLTPGSALACAGDTRAASGDTAARSTVRYPSVTDIGIAFGNRTCWASENMNTNRGN